jgi:hypothetical protein
MKVIREYEQRARQCRELAKAALPRHREAIERIAETWSKLARERRDMLKRQKELSTRAGSREIPQKPSRADT